MQQEIPAKLVKQLRDITDAGIMECKNALKECGGDIDKAVDLLKKKGLSKAAKKADRVATEGVIAMRVCPQGGKATMLEVNSETDFVAKNEAFQELVSNALEIAFEGGLNDVSALMKMGLNGQTFEEYLQQKIAIIGENIVIRRVVTVECKTGQIVNGYLHHNKRIGALVRLECDKQDKLEKLLDLAKELSMQVASMKPKVTSHNDLSLDLVKQEKEALIAELKKENEGLQRLGKTLNRIPEFVSRLELSKAVLDSKREELKQKLKEEGKPEKIWDKVIAGQMDRFILDNSLLDQRLTLLSQPYAFDDKKTVEAVVDSRANELGVKLKVLGFNSFTLGEGLEKKVDDFASEVAAQMRG